jgi:hypothetical protein
MGYEMLDVDRFMADSGDGRGSGIRNGNRG